MADLQYVMVDGQLCRKVESFEPVDIAQVEAVVNQHEANLAQLCTEKDVKVAELNNLEAQIGEAERLLEESKRGLAAARTVVETESDEDGAEGTAEDASSSEAANRTSEFLVGV